MWAAVRQVTGKSHNDHVTVDGITATSLNLHYAAVFTDTDYKVPSPKQTSSIHPHIEYLSEWEVFRQLDTLRSTTTGLDGLRACLSSLQPQYFYRAMLCIRGTSHGPVFVCLCPSVTSRSSTKTAERIGLVFGM